MIIVVGSINMDISLRVQAIPKPGETVLAGSVCHTPGGKGANQAVAAAKMGAEVVMLGCVGNDALGIKVLDSLRKANVATNEIIKKKGTTSTAYICVSDKGENAIVVDSVTNFSLRPEHLYAREELFRQAQYCVLQMEIPTDTVEAAMNLCRKHRVHTIVNPSPASRFAPEQFYDIDYLVPNEYEIETLLNKCWSQITDMDLQQFMQRYLIKNMVITLGERGCVYLKDEGERVICPISAKQAIDTTGAGDTFLGVMAACLDEGATLIEAVRHGNAASGLEVMRQGTQEAMPTREEVEKELVNYR